MLKEALNKTVWVNAIKKALEGKSPETYGVEIKDCEGGIHVIIPPGRRLFPDDDSRPEVTEGWTIGAEGSQHFDRYPTLEALVEAESSEDWAEIIWPRGLS
jgi:hypothetical protein